MSDNHEKISYTDNEEASFYQTGSTKPPKSHRGIILFLLGLVIFLGGIATALGLTNLQLFKELASREEAASCAVGFSDTDEQTRAADEQSTGIGFYGETVSEFWHNYHGLPRGVFIQSVDEGSDAARQGILPGDILIRINGQSVQSLEQMQALLADAESTVDIVLYRDENEIPLQLQLPNQ